jgi:aromatic-L-amino-acid/L-tryptophan decarboxylase
MNGKLDDKPAIKPEETLDPEDWDELRALGHRMVDDMLAYLESLRERPVWQPLPDAVTEALQTPIPRQPQGAQAAYEDFQQYVLPYPTGNIHPRFWGWVMGTGTPFAALTEMLAATVNSNMAGGHHAPNRVEAQVVAWLRSLLGFPDDASGLLVSGASMANLIALTVARNAKAPFDVREHGLPGGKHRMTLYASKETHSSVQKAAEVLGLGKTALRLVDVGEDFAIDMDKLELTIKTDIAMGYQPFCVVGNAGTVNTGAVDDLQALADLCRRYDLWLHIDGAFGALAALAPRDRHQIAGIEQADSLGFDLHKWLYMPFEAGCVLVRHRDEHRRTFALTPDYLAHGERGIAGRFDWFSDYDVQLSRGFRALKVWMSIKAEGIDRFGRLIQQNIDQARYLGRLVEQTPQLELLAPVTLNVVCFRFNPGGISEFSLNRLNEKLLYDLQEQGIAAPSSTLINGEFALRCAITNHRSRRSDFDFLVQQVLIRGGRLAQTITQEWAAVK